MREIKYMGINIYTNEFEYWWPNCDINTPSLNDFWIECEKWEQYSGMVLIQ